jgi:hypothetical protein
MSERIEFTVGLPPRGLRVNSATRVTGWRAALKHQYQMDVWCAGRESTFVPGRGAMVDFDFQMKPLDRAVLRLTWKHAGVAPDQDNALASLKSLIDVLHTKSNRPLGIIVDDSPECLRIEPVTLEKVRHRVDEGVVVVIERVEAVAEQTLAAHPHGGLVHVHNYRIGDGHTHG